MADRRLVVEGFLARVLSVAAAEGARSVRRVVVEVADEIERAEGNVPSPGLRRFDASIGLPCFVCGASTRRRIDRDGYGQIAGARETFREIPLCEDCAK